MDLTPFPLNRDLAFIKQLINAPIFGEAKYLLAICSLMKAMYDENTLQTQAKSFLFSKRASRLSTEYADLARKIKYMLPRIALFTQENLSIIYENSVKNRVLTPPPPLSVQESAITVIQEEPVKKKQISTTTSSTQTETACKSKNRVELFFDLVVRPSFAFAFYASTWLGSNIGFLIAGLLALPGVVLDRLIDPPRGYELNYFDFNYG